MSQVNAASSIFPTQKVRDVQNMEDLNSSDFLQLMIAELQSQDPLNPMDNHELVQQIGAIRELSQEDLRAVLEVHLLGAFHVLQPAFRKMCDAGYGRIVLTSSVGGLYGNERCVNYGMSKSAMLGLGNIAALEGEEFNVKCNTIVPGAVTRMAEGLDISQYPPMEPELVAPVVGWLAHESCPVTGEMIASIAGRIARCFIAETRGVYRPSWTIEQVGEAMAQVHDKGEVLDFGLHGHVDHIVESFRMARGG